MNILEIAESSFQFRGSHGDEELEAFAKAVIKEYKASLVPVAHIDINNRKLEFTTKFDFSNLALCGDYPNVQLYALGEPK